MKVVKRVLYPRNGVFPRMKVVKRWFRPRNGVYSRMKWWKRQVPGSRCGWFCHTATLWFWGKWLVCRDLGDFGGWSVWRFRPHRDPGARGLVGKPWAGPC